MSKDPITHATDEHYKKIDYNERMLESFSSDTETIFSDISILIEKAKDISKGYEDFSFDEEIIEAVNDMLPLHKTNAQLHKELKEAKAKRETLDDALFQALDTMDYVRKAWRESLS